MRRRLFELSRTRRRLADRVWVATANKRQTLHSQYRRWVAWRTRRAERRWVRRQERSLAPGRSRRARVARAAAAALAAAAVTGVAAFAGGSSPERLAQWAPDVTPDDEAEQPAAATGREPGAGARDRNGDAGTNRHGKAKPERSIGIVGASAPDRASTGDGADRESGGRSGPPQLAARPRSPRTGGPAPPRARAQPNSGRSGESVRPNTRPTGDREPTPVEPTTPVAPEPAPAPAPAEPAPPTKPEKPPKPDRPPAGRTDPSDDDGDD